MTTSFPIVSVVMPIRNEAGYIGGTLQAVLDQDYPADAMEVLVVDGMSTDHTREIVRDLQARHPNIRLIDNPSKIVPTGLNKAISGARGEIIIRVDGHTTIAPDYIRQCVEALQRTGADNVGGRMDAVGSTLFGKAVAAATSTPFGVGGSHFHYSNREEWVDSVYMGAWRREVFGKVGLFDEELVRDQDDEFNYRLRKHVGKILLTPRIKSVYTVRSQPKALWKQYYQYGYWKVRVFQKHPRQMSPRHFAPLILVLGLLVSALLAMVAPPWGRILFGAALGLYLAANLAASLMTAARTSWSYLPYLPVAFAALHFGYGLGFLVGLVKFARRWRFVMQASGRAGAQE